MNATFTPETQVLATLWMFYPSVIASAPEWSAQALKERLERTATPRAFVSTLDLLSTEAGSAVELSSLNLVVYAIPERPLSLVPVN